MGAAHGAPARTDANIGAVRDPGGGLCYRKPSVTQRRTSAAAVGCNHCNQGANRLNFPVWSHHIGQRLQGVCNYFYAVLRANLISPLSKS